jgi:hypothetical protein
MRKFLVIAILAGLAWLFVVQKRNEAAKPPKTAPTVVTTSIKPGPKTTGALSTSPRPVSEHNWMKHSLDRANEVKQQVVQQRKADGTR